MNSLKINQGFTLVELLAALVIVTFSAGATMYGVATIRTSTDKLNTKEKAFDQLENYTEFWKAKIASGEWSGTNSWISGQEFDLINKKNAAVKAVMSRKGVLVNGDYPYPLYALETKITWDDGTPQELNLKVYQIEFK